MNTAHAALGIALSASLAGFIAWVAQPVSVAPPETEPTQHREGGYLGSGACQACHPSEHASWKKTHHRSMTRRVSELRWDGDTSPQLPVELVLDGRSFKIKRDGSEIRVLGPDLHRFGRAMSALAHTENLSPEEKLRTAELAFEEIPEVEGELSLITGSHHYLAFWVGGGAEQELRQLPFIYRLDEGKFVPRRDAFLQPPDALAHVARWNSNCIQCHSLAGRPRQSEGHDDVTGEFWEKYETDVVELGISCENCHGPGGKHAEHYQDPKTRFLAHREDSAPEFIINPTRLSAEGDKNVCGQCHSYFLPSDPDIWWESGFTTNYQAGDALSDSRTLLRADPIAREEAEALQAVEANRDSLFWKDGSMIVGGREYNGLIESPCFLRGSGEKKLSCTSCHSMHEGDPNDQLTPKLGEGDSLCTQCHQDPSPDHTRHDPESVGSRCVSCHMPKTSYALLSGIRSHRITSPRLGTESPPNACVLCHVDQTQRDLDEELAKFGGAQGPKKQGASEETAPWGAKLALSGNAAQRAIFAHALGTKETRLASNPALVAQLLDHLKRDPYAAVRLIAERSSRDLPKATSPAPISPSMIKDLLRAQDQTPIIISE